MANLHLTIPSTAVHSPEGHSAQARLCQFPTRWSGNRLRNSVPGGKGQSEQKSGLDRNPRTRCRCFLQSEFQLQSVCYSPGHDVMSVLTYPNELGDKSICSHPFCFSCFPTSESELQIHVQSRGRHRLLFIRFPLLTRFT